MDQLTATEAAEKVSYEEGDFQDVPPSDIVAYNELRSCADLYRMYDDEVLDVSPTFQREVAWKGPAQTRFIDSLMKQLPIPSLCFSYDYKNENWQVIDGLQRISSVIRFLDEKSDWTLAALDDIDPRIANKNVKDFRKKGTELNKLRRRVENAMLPITVLRCDPSLESHSNYLFTIFHRLNTGGLKLNNQEIRNCIFSGGFNDMLRELDHNESWLKINGLDKPVNDRFKRQEVILRFFAFYETFETYKEGLAKFLNNYMRTNRSQSDLEIEEKKALFTRVVNVIKDKLGAEIAKERLNLSLFESLMVGIARNIDKAEALPPAEAVEKLNTLKTHEEFTEEKLVEGLSKTVRVLGRLNAAINTFG
ncbi:DUF262 domain-containing protein [Massilia sp. NR 4-1]|uniref:DUF262 domain-containing protein n=1 Tax=Massilia sp. NR 4-1 TaxID=1678028 RepID=UPI0006A2A9A5|nr:DUF262 domain-containing protein [Massilia sp. NR 4-1]AKU23502.1 hypothetical protein ACZ75_20620 [Massilia sp. NR 4-1]